MNWRHQLQCWFGRRTLGQRGEAAAARHLKRLGYTIVARSVRSSWGELDLVAVDGRTIVFVEVKTRRCDVRGAPVDAVDRHKQRRITNLALAYLKRHDLLECAARFDIISVVWPRDAKKPAIKHYRNAFEAQGVGQMFS